MFAKIHAVPSSPRANTWQLLFRFLDTDGNENMSLPAIAIPCSSYDQCVALADLYNHPQLASRIKRVER